MAGGSKSEMLPEDLVFRILVWLPVASLLRFKSVCKSWLSHIGSSHFISQHTHRLPDSEDNKLVVLNSDFRRYFYFCINFISVDNLQLFKYIEFSPTDELHNTNLWSNQELIASFDGIVCLKHATLLEDKGRVILDDVVSLWNPATTQFTMLPPGQSDIKANLYSPYVVIEYGFGFDVKINDYKVVRVILECDDVDTESFRSLVEVYSLSMGSWRILDAVLPLNFHITHNPNQPFRNEIYCWSGYDQSTYRYLILSFDFSKEVFGIMPVPDVCSDPSEGGLILSFLRGKIACIYWIYDYPHQNDRCKIWELDKYGVKESWTNLYVIRFDQVDRPVGFSMDGKIILIKGDVKRKLYLCDPLTQEVKEVPTQGHIFEASVYKESLISVKSAGGVPNRVIYEDLSKTLQHLISLGNAESGPEKIYLPDVRKT